LLSSQLRLWFFVSKANKSNCQSVIPHSNMFYVRPQSPENHCSFSGKYLQFAIFFSSTRIFCFRFQLAVSFFRWIHDFPKKAWFFLRKVSNLFLFAFVQFSFVEPTFYNFVKSQNLFLLPLGFIRCHPNNFNQSPLFWYFIWHFSSSLTRLTLRTFHVVWLNNPLLQTLSSLYFLFFSFLSCFSSSLVIIYLSSVFCFGFHSRSFENNVWKWRDCDSLKFVFLERIQLESQTHCWGRFQTVKLLSATLTNSCCWCL
jgi:hypothetical protein